MNLDPSIKQALDEMGYAVPMEVQHVIYDRAMAGRDLMVQSRTGSGKTAGFGIPIAQQIAAGSSGVQAMILAPTRELALQVAQEMQRICAYRNLQVVPIYGGAPMGRQIEALKAGAQIVAGTPGRVLDHIRRGTLNTSGIKILVLDECDEMLSMGFQEEIEKIVSELPPKDRRQTLLFSATIPAEIERIGKRHMREYDKVVLSADFVGVHEIDHRYYLVSGMSRTRDLLRVLQYEQPGSAIIFCNTRDDTALVAGFLQRQGYIAEPISSDLTQSDRERVMGLMRAGTLQFLCATDIAARGIDISGLSHVINYTFPESPEVYIHRTGRTGRAGKSGVAVSLIGPREIGSFYYLKLLYKIKPEERELPTEAELRTRREGDRFARVAQDIGEETVDDEWRAVARRVWHSGDGERLVAALIKRMVESASAPTAGAPAAVTPTPPPRAAVPVATAAFVAPSPRAEGVIPAGGLAAGNSGDLGIRSRADGEELRPPRRHPHRSIAVGVASAAGVATDAVSAVTAADARRATRRRVVSPRPPRPGKPRPPAAGNRASSGRPGSTRKLRAPSPRLPRRPSDRKVPRRAPRRTPKANGVRVHPRSRDRGDRSERRDRAAEEPGWVRLYINVGTREGLALEDVTRLVGEVVSASGAGDAPDAVDAIARAVVLGTHSYVSVKEAIADAVCAGLQSRKIGDRAIIAERALK